MYEGARAARQAYRAREDLDRAHGRGPEKVHAEAYAIPADDRGRPGRTLLLRNGDLVLTVSAYAPYGSTARDVRGGLEQIVEGAAHRTERGLRASGSPAPLTNPAVSARWPAHRRCARAVGRAGVFVPRAVRERTSQWTELATREGAVRALASPGPVR